MAVVVIDYQIKGVPQVNAADKAVNNLNKANKDASKSAKTFNKSQEKTAENAKKTSKAVSGLGDDIKNSANQFRFAGKGAGDLGAGLLKVAQGGDTVTKSMKLLRVAIAATGIGALVILIASLTAAFKSSEAGQAKFRKVLSSIGVVVGNISDIFADFGLTIIDAIKNPAKAWDSFKDSLKAGADFIERQVIDRVISNFDIMSLGIAKGILKMQIAWNEFTNDTEDIQNLNKELEEVQKGIDASRASIARANAEIVGTFSAASAALVEFIQHNKDELAIVSQLERLRLDTDRLERQFRKDRAVDEAKIAELRLKAREEEEFSAEQRLEFLREARRLGDELADQELVIAKNRETIAIKFNEFSKSTKENLDAEAQATARVSQIEAERSNKQRQIQRELIRVLGQQRGLERAIQQEKEDAFQREKEAREELSIFILETNGDLIKAEELRIKRDLENTKLGLFERELLIEESEQRITDIKRDQEEERLKTEQQIAKVRLDLEQSTVGGIIALAKELTKGSDEIQQVLFILEKAFAVAQVFVDLAKIKSLNVVSAAGIVARGLGAPGAIARGATFLAAANAAANTNAALQVGLIQAQTVAGLAFKEGVIDLQGPGTATSDSIPARLSKGESVMTSSETSDFLPTFKAIRKGHVDPELLNAISMGDPTVIDATKVIETTGYNLSWDERGFTSYMRKGNARTIKNAKRFKN